MANEEHPTGELKTRTVNSGRLFVSDDGRRVDPFLGKSIGGYDVRELLGQGGFGSVYLADQTSPVRRPVALKIIKLGMDTREVIARFEQERQALAVMDHPGVAEIFDAGVTEDGRPFFVMEYIDGVPITRWCDDRQLDVHQRVLLFIEVCRAVQHAHQKGVIHRDIKPSNILVCRQDETVRPVVIDFGIAKATEQPLTDATIQTAQGQFIGTPEYMSPEQAGLATNDIDTRSDVYSLGVLLYELLTGARPFDRAALDNASPTELLRMICEVDPPRPSRRRVTIHDAGDPQSSSRRGDSRSLIRELRRDLDWIVMKCLEKDRTRRYDSVSSLVDDLRRYLSSEPVLASPPSAIYRARKFVRRNRAAVVSSTLLLMMLVTSSVVSINFGVSERQARTAEAEQREIATIVGDFLQEILTSPDPYVDGPDVRVITVLDRAAEIAPLRMAGRAEVDAELQRTLGRAYLSIGSPQRAIPHLEAAREVMTDLGISEATIAEQVDLWLGEALYRQHRCDDALAVLVHAHDVLATHHGPDAIATLDAMNQLGGAYRCAGELPAAEEMYLAAAEGRARSLGEDDRRTLISRHNLALVLRQQGISAMAAGDKANGFESLERARAALDATFRRASETYGKDDPQALASGSALASILNRLDRFEDSETVYAEVLPRMFNALGEQHWRTLETQVNFARLYQRFDRPERAIELFEPALGGYRRVRGAAFADTVLIASYLADAYDAVGEVEVAMRERIRTYHDMEDAQVDLSRLQQQARVIRDRYRHLGNTEAAADWTALCCPDES